MERRLTLTPEFWLLWGVLAIALVTPWESISLLLSGTASGLALRRLRLTGGPMALVVGLAVVGVLVVAVAARWG